MQIHAAFWVTLAGLVAYTTQVVPVALDGSRSSTPWIAMGLACFSVNLTLMLYLLCWLPRVRNIDLPWGIVAPNAVTVGTVAGSLSFVCFVIGLWPAYGLLTPLVCGLLLMGLLFVTHFLPF
jgi:hypothetical protein